MREKKEPIQSFGEFIRIKRVSLGLTQHEVAAMAKTTQGYVCKIENGSREPTLTVALQLCEALGLDVNDFIHQNRK